MFNSEMISLVGVAFWESIYMTIISSFFAYVIGLPLGLILVATDKDGIAPAPLFNQVLGIIINILRSIPFLILLVAMMPITQAVVEAAQSMGASPFEIMTKVLLPEAKPSLLIGSAIAMTTILGYSAMAGFCGGGGLGAVAINYGYYRSQRDIMLVMVVLLVVIVQVLQEVGLRIAKGTDKRL